MRAGQWSGGRWWAGAALGLALAMPQVAQADWRRAETTHFVVYSNGGERGLRDYAVRLERFDALLRRITGDRPPPEVFRKLPVYLVDDGDELRVAQPDLPTGVDGYYRASPEDIRAVLVRGRSDDLLLHEYVHHFMAQNAPGRHPGWFNEGFAEYFATATVDARGKSTFGTPSLGRLQVLQQQRWLPLETVLTANPMTLSEGQRRLFYSQAWLLTHYILSDGGRTRSMDGYLTALGQGAQPIEALSANFGMTPEALTAELRDHLNRLKYAELTIPALAPEMAVTVLPPSADDVMLIWLDIVDGASDERGAALLALARAAAAKHPGDPFAATTLARAELNWGDAARVEPLLAQVLAVAPGDVEALLMMSDRKIEAAAQIGDAAERLVVSREGQGLLVRALETDPTDYRVVGRLAALRRGAPTYPTANDLQTWRVAVALAPQVMRLRGQAAEALFLAGQFDEAEAMLAPIVNDPHGGSDWARPRLEEIRRARAAAASATTP